MVLGRKTYEGLAAVWPQLADDPTLGAFADRDEQHARVRRLPEPPGAALRRRPARSHAILAIVLPMQDDGDVVPKNPANCDQPDVGKICLASDQVYWSSGTGGNPGTRLVMEDSGRLAAWSPDGRLVWPVSW